MTSRGKMLVDLAATPISRRPLMTLSTNPTSTPLSYKEKMDQTQRFLDKIRVPVKADGRDDNHEESLNDQADDGVSLNDAFIGDNEDNENDGEKTDGGHVDFGSLGFINFTSRQEAEVSDEHDGVLDADELNDNPSAESQPGPSGVASNNKEANVSNQDPTDDATAVPDSTGRKRATEQQKVVAKKRKTVNQARKDLVDETKKKTEAKNPRAAKKGFKDNYQTLKFKISSINTKAGSSPDFALFVFDNVHDPASKPSTPHAGKYLTYMKGNISTKFFSQQGISYNPKDFYICENEIDLSEDKVLPVQKAVEISRMNLASDHLVVSPETVEAQELEAPVVEAPVEAPVVEVPLVESPETEVVVNSIVVEENEREGITVGSNSDKDVHSDVDSDLDIFNMRKKARSVSWGAPDYDSDTSSDSDNGVYSYGRAAGKTLSEEKKKKNSEKKKRARDANNKATTDILENNNVASGSGKQKSSARGGLIGNKVSRGGRAPRKSRKKN